MTGKDLKNNPDIAAFRSLFEEKGAVVLLRGKNSFGDLIFSYVKIVLSNIERLQSSVQNHTAFTPSDFGEVIAAGRGEPSEELQAEIAAQYPVLDDKAGTNKTSGSGASAAAPIAKKAWDEY